VPDAAASLRFEHLAEITAIDPAAAGRAPDEMLGLVLGCAPSGLPK
jgi:hypothetical protein